MKASFEDLPSLILNSQHRARSNVKGQAQARTVCAGGSPLTSFFESLQEGIVVAPFVPAERISQMEICNGRMDPCINMPFLVSMQYSAGTFISGQAHDIAMDPKENAPEALSSNVTKA